MENKEFVILSVNDMQQAILTYENPGEEEETFNKLTDAIAYLKAGLWVYHDSVETTTGIDFIFVREVQETNPSTRIPVIGA